MKEVAVATPEILTSPVTSNADVGVVDLIPTLEVVVIPEAPVVH